ncbi:uncharacterized protein ISCGN_010199 [Ixodes scapularis]
MELSSLIASWLPSLPSEDVETVVSKLEECGVATMEHLKYIEESDLDLLNPVNRRILLERFREVSVTTKAPIPAAQPTASVPLPSTSRFENWSEDFSIPWDSFPQRLLEACYKNARPTKSDLNQMVRQLSNRIIQESFSPGRRHLRVIASKIVAKYPLSFQDMLQGTVIGQGVETLLWKLENCVNNKKRPLAQPLPEESTSDPDAFHQPAKTDRRDSYGCVAWKPELPPGETAYTQDEKRERLVTEYRRVSRDDRLVTKLMSETYATQRLLINSSKGVGKVKEDWPFLFEEHHFLNHAELLLGFNVSEVFDDNMKKVGVQLYRYAYSQLKNEAVKKCLKDIEDAKKTLKNVTPEYDSTPLLLLAIFGEDIELIFKNVEENATDSDLGDMDPSPIICVKGANNYTASEFTICVDTVPVMTTSNRAGSFKLMFLLYFVLNISFPEEVGLTLEFIQRGIASINPPRGTKILKKKKKQHCVSPAVAKLMASLEEYAF